MDIKKHLIEDDIPSVKLTNEQKNEVYEDMLIINKMERYLEEKYSEKKIRGFCHLVIGQEGLYAVLKKIMKNDLLISSYRCHGAGYAAGIPIKEIISENLGLRGGNCKGKGGSMHLYNNKFFGGHGIVGAQVPIGAGLAFAIKYKNYQNGEKKNTKKESKDPFKRMSFIRSESDAVCFTLYGDGASNQGQVYETFNMAKVFNLPIVFIVENNKYGMYTLTEDVSIDDCFYKRGYGIPGLRVSDAKIEELYSAVSYAKSYSLFKGPIIVQVDTNRTCGHSTLDIEQNYRSIEDIKNKDFDCLSNLRKLISERELNEIENRVESSFNMLISSIDFDDFPGKEQLFTDIFSG